MAAVSDPIQPQAAAPAHQELRDRGVGLFVIFSAATLLMVAAIAAVGLVDSWWVLAPVMLVDLALTVGVVSGIARLLSGDDDSADRPRP
jgi:hypothetical protein